MQTLVLVVLSLGCLLARAEEIQVPKLKGGYLADRDHVLHGREGKKLIGHLKAIEQASGTKPILDIVKKIPIDKLKASDFDPNMAAVGIIARDATEWGEGTHRTQPGDSVVICFAPGPHGVAISGPPEMEKQFFTGENLERFRQALHDFYKVWRVTRREYAHHKAKHFFLRLVGRRPPSPEFMGLEIMLNDLKPNFLAVKH